MGLTDRLPRRRIVNSLLAALVLAGTLTGCALGDDKTKSRPLTKPELDRLASMRMRNFSDGRVGIAGTIGVLGKQTSVSGWIDWRRAQIYLSASAAGTSALVQAKPGVIAIRPGEPTKPITGQPPQPPPVDGWRIRPIALTGEEKAPLDNLLAFLFLIARDQPDRADLLAPLKTQWVRRDNTQGADVDVMLGPAVLPEATPPPAPSPEPSATTIPLDPASLEFYGGAVGYWLDADGRLRRVEALLGSGLPTTIDFLRDQQQEFSVVDGLGGREISPREVTEAEATLISAMRQRTFRTKGAQVTVTMPVLPGALRTARGWLDWQRGLVYLSVQDVDDPTYDILLHANKTSVSIRKIGGRAPDSPTLPAPKGSWERSEWSKLSGSSSLTDLDIAVFEALSMGVDKLDDVKNIRAGAKRLRVDVLNGVAVGVFELPNAVEQQLVAPGQARIRYWLDNSGVLRRLEVRTNTGGFAQLDLTLGAQLPSLPGTVS